MLPMVRSTAILPRHDPVSNLSALHELSDYVIGSCLVVDIIYKDLVLILLLFIRVSSLHSWYIIVVAPVWPAAISPTVVLVNFRRTAIAIVATTRCSIICFPVAAKIIVMRRILIIKITTDIILIFHVAVFHVIIVCRIFVRCLHQIIILLIINIRIRPMILDIWRISIYLRGRSTVSSEILVISRMWYV